MTSITFALIRRPVDPNAQTVESEHRFSFDLDVYRSADLLKQDIRQMMQKHISTRDVLLNRIQGSTDFTVITKALAELRTYLDIDFHEVCVVDLRNDDRSDDPLLDEALCQSYATRLDGSRVGYWAFSIDHYYNLKDEYERAGIDREVIRAAAHCGVCLSDVVETYKGEYLVQSDFAEEYYTKDGSYNLGILAEHIDWDSVAEQMIGYGDIVTHNDHYFKV